MTGYNDEIEPLQNKSSPLTDLLTYTTILIFGRQTNIIQIHEIRSLTVNQRKSDTPNELAACDEAKPYSPPLYPFTICTNPSNSGWWLGRNLPKNGFMNLEVNWSASAIVKAIPSTRNTLCTPYLLKMKYRTTAKNGNQYSCSVRRYIRSSKKGLFKPFKNRRTCLSILSSHSIIHQK